MHDVEEGTLTWANATQCSLNRLSASQFVMTNITTAPQGRNADTIMRGPAPLMETMKTALIHAHVAASRGINLNIKKSNVLLKI